MKSQRGSNPRVGANLLYEESCEMKVHGLSTVSVERCILATENFSKFHNVANAKWNALKAELDSEVVRYFFGLCKTTRYIEIVGDSWHPMRQVQKKFPHRITTDEIAILDDCESKSIHKAIKNLIGATDDNEILANSEVAEFIMIWG